MARTHVAAGPLRELMGALSMPPAPRPPGQPGVVDVAVLAALGQLIAADAVIFNDLAPRRRSVWVEASSLPGCDQPDDPDALEVFYRHFWSASCSHPTAAATENRW